MAANRRSTEPFAARGLSYKVCGIRIEGLGVHFDIARADARLPLPGTVGL